MTIIAAPPHSRPSHGGEGQVTTRIARDTPAQMSTAVGTRSRSARQKSSAACRRDRCMSGVYPAPRTDAESPRQFRTFPLARRARRLQL